jgi:HlyD family secretion protein
VSTAEEPFPAELTLTGGASLRARLLWALALAVVAGGVAFVTYATWFSGGGEAQRDLEPYTVTRKTLRSTVAASGVAAAQEVSDVSFDHPGRVKTVAVTLGQQVKAGDVLATLDEPDAENAVAAAQSNLRTAELKLLQLVNGASLAEIAAAEQAVASAQAAYDKALNDLRKLELGPTSAEIASAEQAVRAAEANLADAEARLAGLVAQPGDAAVASARAAVTAAQNALDQANAAADDADASVASAAGEFQDARAEYCANAEALASICVAVYTPPLSDADLAALEAQLDATDVLTQASFVQDQSALLSANAAYRAAVAARDKAHDTIDELEQQLEAAELKLRETLEGPDAATLDAAGAAVTAAEQALRAAQAKLDDLLDGADPDDVALARSQVASAEASLRAAQAKLDDLLDGADPDDVALAQENVRSARVALDKALIQREKGILRAPFDGTVAAINVHPGELASSAQPAFTLLTPDALRLDLTIGEVDLPNVKVGQPGGIIFDAIQGRPYFFVITSIGLAPQVQQGVVTYIARANLILPGDAPKPAPGMNGAALIQLEQRTNVLTVPARGVRRRGDQKVVDVQNADGTVEERVVETGLSDGQDIEIVSGLSEGETVLLPRLAGGSTAGSSQDIRLPGGIR